MGPGPPLHAPRPSQLGGLTEPLMASVSSPGRQPSNPLLRQPADPGVRASGPGSPGPWLGGWAGQSPGCGDPVCACACTGRCAHREGRAPRAAADARVGTRPLRPAPTPSWCPPALVRCPGRPPPHPARASSPSGRLFSIRSLSCGLAQVCGVITALLPESPEKLGVAPELGTRGVGREGPVLTGSPGPTVWLGLQGTTPTSGSTRGRALRAWGRGRALRTRGQGRGRPVCPQPSLEGTPQEAPQSP